uniref:Fe2OG dioxygenase domain-containing protein n=1 Tax=Zooxanthella nutricula TaxID=1333877 RepID=A0A7S2NT34_9DINO
MAAIPTIDFAPFLADEGCVVGESPTAGQFRVAEQIDGAMREHGFLYMDLGIPGDEVQAMFDIGRLMFERPEHEKCAELARWTADTNQGYVPMLTEGLNPKRAPDVRDGFVVKSPHVFDNDLRGTPAGFDQAVSAFWDKLEVATRRFGFACALALGLPSSDLDFFAKHFGRCDMCVMRYNHYPPCDFVPGSTDGSSATAGLRIGEHTDFGTFTFVFMDGEARGLQARKTQEGDALGVENVEGADPAWFDVPGRGGGVAVVNSGAMLAQWTNDVWKATAHRVIVPDAEEASQHRYTLPFFAVADTSAVVETHPVLVPEGEKPRYAPTTSGEYIRMRLKAMEDGGQKLPVAP